jgi:hypothetical protein
VAISGVQHQQHARLATRTSRRLGDPVVLQV